MTLVCTPELTLVLHPRATLVLLNKASYGRDTTPARCTQPARVDDRGWEVAEKPKY